MLERQDVEESELGRLRAAKAMQEEATLASEVESPTDTPMLDAGAKAMDDETNAAMGRWYEINNLLIPGPIYMRIRAGMDRATQAGALNVGMRDVCLNLILLGLSLVEAREQAMREANNLVVAPASPQGLDREAVAAKLRALRKGPGLDG